MAIEPEWRRVCPSHQYGEKNRVVSCPGSWPWTMTSSTGTCARRSGSGTRGAQGDGLALRARLRAIGAVVLQARGPGLCRRALHADRLAASMGWGLRGAIRCPPQLAEAGKPFHDLDAERAYRRRIIGSRQRPLSANVGDPSGAFEPCWGAAAGGDLHRDTSAYRSRSPSAATSAPTSRRRRGGGGLSVTQAGSARRALGSRRRRRRWAGNPRARRGRP